MASYLTAAQLEALNNLRHNFGPGWKSALLLMWKRPSVAPSLSGGPLLELQALHGAAWLESFELPRVLFHVGTPGGSLTLCQFCLAAAFSGRPLFAEEAEGPPVHAVDIKRLRQVGPGEASACLSCDLIPSSPPASSEEAPDA